MPRTRPDDRFETICSAALRVFTRRGYERARMDQIAREANVSPGTLYLYAENKQALFLVLVRWLSLREPLPTDLPVPTPEPGEAVAALRKGLANSTARPRLEGALARKRAPDIEAELREIVGELYDVLHDNRDLIALVESCAQDWPELYEVYFRRDRRSFFRQLADYLELRIGTGQLPPVSDLAVTTRFVVESVNWFARKAPTDADLARVDPATIRAEVQELLVGALAKS